MSDNNRKLGTKDISIFSLYQICCVVIMIRLGLLKGLWSSFKTDNDTCKESIVRSNIGQCPLIISTKIYSHNSSFSHSLSLSPSLFLHMFIGISLVHNREKHYISTFSIFEHLNIPKRITSNDYNMRKAIAYGIIYMCSCVR